MSRWLFPIKPQGVGKRLSYSIVGVLVIFALLENAKDGSFNINMRVMRMQQQKEKTTTRSMEQTFPYYHEAMLVKSGSAFENDTSAYLERMIHDDRLVRSAQQQSKFFARRKAMNHDLLNNFPVETLFQTFMSAWAAVPLNKEWAYVHIWKSGGTTMQKQAIVGDNNKRADQVSIQSLQNTHKSWFTFVRDPLDHFLSGYSECGYRGSLRIMVSDLPPWNESDYDRRVGEYLDLVKQSSGWLPCELHSYPQVNSLLNSAGQFHPQIKAIGDVQEMPAFLDRITGFAFNHNKTTGNDATTNPIKVNYFPARRDLLSDETLRKICQYIALDYYFFDYEPPPACRRQEHENIMMTPHAQPANQSQQLKLNQQEEERIRTLDQKVKTKLEIEARRQKLALQKKEALLEQFKQKQKQQALQAKGAQTETANKDAAATTNATSNRY